MIHVDHKIMIELLSDTANGRRDDKTMCTFLTVLAHSNIVHTHYDIS